MNSKIRRVNLEELKLWKEVTKNDKKIKEYLDENKAEKITKTLDKKLKKIPQKRTHISSSEENKKKNNANEDLQINKSTLLKLKRGKINIEAQLDLHGYSKNNAKNVVKNFIRESVSNNLRCILIITGKKNTFWGASGVLRESLPDWLKEEDISYMSLANCFATIKDGGDGARYVLLRKKDKVL